MGKNRTEILIELSNKNVYVIVKIGSDLSDMLSNFNKNGLI